MGKKTHGPLLVVAVETNDHKKVHDICTQVKDKVKIRGLITADIRRLGSDVPECPIISAAGLDDPSIIKYFCSNQGVDVNFLRKAGLGKRVRTETPLLVAVKLGLYKTVDAMLSMHADANVQDHRGCVALHYSVANADYRLTKMLLVKGANSNIADKTDNTPLHIATKYGHVELVKLLLKYGAEIYKKGAQGAIPLHMAAKEGHIALIKLFGLHDVNMDIRVPCFDEMREMTPLHVAAEQGHVELLMTLVEEYGADINSQDSEGETPLHCCTLREYDPLGMKSKDEFSEAAKALVRYGADVNIKNFRGETPLHAATRNEFQKIVEILIVGGSDPLIQDNDKNKAIDLVSDEDTVTKQMIKKAMDDREKMVSEALELQTRGFSTSLRSLPFSSVHSQSFLNMPAMQKLSGSVSGSMGRTMSTPGIYEQFSNGPGVPMEDGYLQPHLERQGRIGSFGQGSVQSVHSAMLNRSYQMHSRQNSVSSFNRSMNGSMLMHSIAEGDNSYSMPPDDAPGMPMVRSSKRYRSKSTDRLERRLSNSTIDSDYSYNSRDLSRQTSRDSWGSAHSGSTVVEMPPAHAMAGLTPLQQHQLMQQQHKQREYVFLRKPKPSSSDTISVTTMGSERSSFGIWDIPHDNMNGSHSQLVRPEPHKVSADEHMQTANPGSMSSMNDSTYANSVTGTYEELPSEASYAELDDVPQGNTGGSYGKTKSKPNKPQTSGRQNVSASAYQKRQQGQPLAVSIPAPQPAQITTSAMSPERKPNSTQGGMSDSDDTFFDDDSFDTVSESLLDAPEHNTPNTVTTVSSSSYQESSTSNAPTAESQKLAELKKRLAEDPKLQNWLVEQAAIVRDRGTTETAVGPVAQSSPPQMRAINPHRAEESHESGADSDSSAGEGKKKPALKPKPAPRKKPVGAKPNIPAKPGGPPVLQKLQSKQLPPLPAGRNKFVEIVTDREDSEPVPYENIDNMNHSIPDKVAHHKQQAIVPPQMRQVYQEQADTDDMYSASKKPPVSVKPRKGKIESEYMKMNAIGQDTKKTSHDHTVSSDEEVAGYQLDSRYSDSLKENFVPVSKAKPGNLGKSKAFVPMPGAKELSDRFTGPTSQSIEDEYRFHKTIGDVSSAASSHIQSQVGRRMSEDNTLDDAEIDDNDAYYENFPNTDENANKSKNTMVQPVIPKTTQVKQVAKPANSPVIYTKIIPDDESDGGHVQEEIARKQTKVEETPPYAVVNLNKKTKKPKTTPPAPPPSAFEKQTDRGKSYEDSEKINRSFDIDSRNKSFDNTDRKFEGTSDDVFTKPEAGYEQIILDPDDKRRVTIGTEEIIPHQPLSREINQREITYNTEGKVRYSLVGGNSDGIFIHNIEPGSDAEARGLLEGDQIMKINGLSTKGKTREETVMFLMSIQRQVTVVVRYKRERYDRIMENGGSGDSFYVRAQFNYSAEKEGELSVSKGDIFSVRDTMPASKMGYWRALKVHDEPRDRQHGLIPNYHRAEQLALASQLQERGRSMERKADQINDRGNFIMRSFGKSKSVDRLNRKKKKVPTATLR